MKCQIGDESPNGTPTAATAIWRGKVSMEDLTKVTFVDEDVGNYAGVGRSYIASEGAAITFDSTPATYEQISYIFRSGVQSGNTSSIGATYTWYHTMASTAATTITTNTIEFGDGEDVDEASYCFVESYTISGAPDEAVMVTANWRGRQSTQTTFSGSATLPAVEDMLFNTGKLYIDNSGGTVGDTQVSNSFRSFTLNVTTGWQAIQTADGNLYFTMAKLTAPEVTLEITAEHDSTWDSAGEKANWVAQTARLVRLEFTGTQDRRFRIDLAGKWETFSSIEEEDGNSVLRGTMRAFYSSADTLFHGYEVRNLTADLL
jgi:hypothetical protein